MSPVDPLRPWGRSDLHTAGPSAVSQGHRALIGLLSVVVFTAGEGWIALASPPTWLAIWFPVPAALVAADALLPRPILAQARPLPVQPALENAAAAVIVAASLAIGVSAVGQIPATWDQPLTLTCAARDLMHGRVPYLTYEPQCEASLNFHGTASTPIATGPFQHDAHYPSATAVATQMRADQQSGTHSGFPAFGYPPLAALLVLPVAYSSWAEIDLWVCLLTILALGLMFIRQPDLPPLLIAWQCAGLASLWYAFGWNPEEIAYLLLAIAFARLRWPRVSAVALALALLSNPISWVVAPVYLAIISHQPNFQTRLRWLAAALMATLLPWLLWDPALPHQLWTFVTLPEFPLGATVATLFAIHSQWHPVFLLLFILVIVGCAVTALRRPSLGWAMVPIAFLSFLVSWHAPVYYYLAVLWLTPAVALGLHAPAPSFTPSPTAAPHGPRL